MKTRQLYAAFELLRTDHMFAGLAHLAEPLIRSLCDLTLLIIAGPSSLTENPRHGVEALRQQLTPPSPNERELKDIIEYLQFMSAEPCDTAASAGKFSGYAWKILLVLQSLGRKSLRANLLSSHSFKALAAAAFSLLPIIATGYGILTLYRHWRALQLPPATTQRVADLNNLKTALFKFNKDHGHYPSTDRRWDGLYTSYGQSSENWIPGLVPDYIDKLPRDPRNHETPDEQYLYWSDGTNFKLLAHNAPDAEQAREAYPEMYDRVREGRAYGVWSPDGERQ